MKNRKQTLRLLVSGVLTISLLATTLAVAANNVVVVPLGARNTGTIITSVGGEMWLPHTFPPSQVERWATGVVVSGDGRMVLGINGPVSLEGIEYGLESFEICLNVQSPGYLTFIEIYRNTSATENEVVLSDHTDRDTSGCYTYPVGVTAGKGLGIYAVLNGGGTIRLKGTTYTWVESGKLTPNARKMTHKTNKEAVGY